MYTAIDNETASHTHKVQIERSCGSRRRRHILNIRARQIRVRQPLELSDLIGKDHGHDLQLVGALVEFEGLGRHPSIQCLDDCADSKPLSIGVPPASVANHENEFPDDGSDRVLTRNSPITADRDAREADATPANRTLHPNPWVQSALLPAVEAELQRRQTGHRRTSSGS